MTSNGPADGWDRRRLLLTLVAAAVTGLALLTGLGFAVYEAVTATRAQAGAPARPAPPGHADSAQARRDAIAADPMLQVGPDAALPARPAAVAGPAIQVPPATGTGPAGVPTGYPRTPVGAVGQLAAIGTAVLQGMSIPYTADVYGGWALPGGPGVERWRLTGNVQAFLGAAQMGQKLDPAAVLVAVPAAGQVKGADGPDWTVACVLLQVRASITTEARRGYGYCERMQWHQGRWMIAPGPPPAPAPSTWPGTDLSLQAGWRSWADTEPGPTR